MGDTRKKLSRQRRRAIEREQRPSLQDSPPLSRGGTPIVESSFSVQWRYHLPPPALLQQYDFIKNGPERLLRMVEDQAQHRRKLENRDSWTESFQRVWGTLSGTLIGVLGVAGGVYLIREGNDISGFVTLIGTLVGLVAVIQGTKPKESDGKAQGATPRTQLELPLREEDPVSNDYGSHEVFRN
jgi:uncharacterized membrane protein